MAGLFFRTSIIFSLLLSGIVLQSADQPATEKVNPQWPLQSDAQALEFCKQKKNTYIAIVWPRGLQWADTAISKGLNTLGKIVYEKPFTLTNKGAFRFYKNAHREFSDSKIRNALNYHYFKNRFAPFKCKAFVFQSNAKLSEIIKRKATLRKYMGQSYWTIHIVDNHKETLELGEWVLNDDIMNKINGH